MKCEDCKKPITEGEGRYSNAAFGRYLCIECQVEERRKRYPKKLVDFLNDRSFKRRGG